MVQKRFGIYSNENNSSSIFLEKGSNYFAIWKENEFASKTDFELFEYSKEFEDKFSSVYNDSLPLSQLLNKAYDEVNFVLASPDAVVIPAKLYNPDLAETTLKLQLGLNGEVDYFKQEINDKMVVAVYPAGGFQGILSKNIIPVHKYSLLLNNPVSDNNIARLYFYSNQFILEIYREGQLQLIRHFTFIHPADVLYQIVNAFKQLKIEPDSLVVSAAGLLDTDSALYELLYQYLPGFTLDTTKTNVSEESAFNEFPAHYFSIFSFKKL